MLWTNRAVAEVADIMKFSENDEIYNLTIQYVITSLIKYIDDSVIPLSRD